MLPLGNIMPAFCFPWAFFPIVHCCFTFVDKERSTDIFSGLYLGPCELLEISNFFLYTHYQFDCLKIWYENSYQMCCTTC